MRIISGHLRGKNLQSPLDGTTRPTSDKARQGIFNILEHAPWSNGIEGQNVLDVFAGTGAMGIEALSRGASFAAFIENGRNALKVLGDNVNYCDLQNISKILKTDVRKIAKKPANLPIFNIVFMDPPYGKELLPTTILSLAEGGWINSETIIIAEYKKGEGFTPPPAFEILREVNYGINQFSILQLNQ